MWVTPTPSLSQTTHTHTRTRVHTYTHRFPGSFAVDAAVRHGCVVLSVEWSSAQSGPVSLGQEQQQFEGELDQIQGAGQVSRRMS